LLILCMVFWSLFSWFGPLFFIISHSASFRFSLLLFF
jgi:hypothetical protein